MFFGGTEIAVREMTKHHEVFRYMYSHKGSITNVDIFLLNPLIFIGKLFFNWLTSWKIRDFGFGTCHGDEAFTLFQPHKMPFTTLLTVEDQIVSDTFLKYLVNFIT